MRIHVVVTVMCIDVYSVYYMYRIIRVTEQCYNRIIDDGPKYTATPIDCVYPFY